MLIGSYYIIEFQESTMTDIGYQINEVGKIRALTFASMLSIDDYTNQNTNYDSTYLTKLENSVQVIQNGGYIDDKRIFIPSEEFASDKLDLNQKYTDFKNNVSFILDSPLEENKKQLSESGIQLINTADQLTRHLAEYNMQLSNKLILISSLLISFNIFTHAGLAFLILKISRSEHKENIKSEKMKIIGELSARMAHDLRNPLSVINMTIEVLSKVNKENNKLRDNEYFSKIQERLDVIQQSVKLMNHQINDVLNFTRITELKKSKESLLDLFKNSILRLNVPTGIQISLPKKDCNLSCDSQKLSIVFLNLLQNSIEAINGSGKIIVRFYEFYDSVTIEIEDSGPGVSKNQESELFVPLFTTKPLGTGLGLITCKNIVEQHKGTISYRSNPTTFVISLPL